MSSDFAARWMIRWLLAALVALGAGPPPAASADLTSYAIVRPDGSLLVQGRAVQLFGIYIPPTERTCRTRVVPARCAPRAALALDSRIKGFVRCAVVAANRDGSVDAFCFVDGDSILESDIDLGAWMIEQGWAVATPEAPFEYTVLERIAQTRGLGVWGFPLDSLRKRFRLDR